MTDTGIIGRGVARSKNVGWTHIASVEREPITGVWGGVSCRIQRHSSGQRVMRAKPPEAENLSAFVCPMEAANLPHFPYFANSLNPTYS